MHLVPKNQVQELIAATDVSSSHEEIDMAKYQQGLIHVSEWEIPDIKFLTSLSGGWDMLEVGEEPDPEQTIFRAGDKKLKLSNISEKEHRVTIRTLLLTPNEGLEMKKMLGLPPWDQYIRVTMVLTEDDRYLPLEARYKGPSDIPSDLDRIIQAATSALSAPEFKIEPQVHAPVLPQKIKDWIKTLASEPIRGYSKENLISDLMALSDLPFVEAIEQIIPFMDEHNAWLNSDPRIAKRTWLWTQAHPEFKDEMNTAPWKSGRSLPRYYRPKIEFSTPEHIFQKPIQVQ